MRKSSRAYPHQFFQLGAKTIRLERWEKEMPTAQNANSFKTKWYNFVSALEAEKDFENWSIAMRVLLNVKGNLVVFEDRDKSELGCWLDEALADEPVDPVMEEFNRMMEKKHD